MIESELMPNMTQKVLDQFELNRKKIVQMREKEHKKEMDKEARIKKEKETADRVRANILVVNEDHDAKIERSKQEKHMGVEKWPSDNPNAKDKLETVTWGQRVKEMEQNIERKGPLLERVGQDSLNKKKDLAKMRQ